MPPNNGWNSGLKQTRVASALDLGISVDEGILPGYDGKIYPSLYGE